MKQTDHNNSFTAADIHRYHAGEMSMPERHAIERAALDDPFLADALEGYQHTPTPQIDLAHLQQQLVKKTTPQRKAVVIGFLQKPWMRAAALVLLLAGAGWTVYQFGLHQKESLLAVSKVAPVEKQQTDTTSITVQQPKVDSTTLVFTAPKVAPVLEQESKAYTFSRVKPAKKPRPDTNAAAEDVGRVAAPVAAASAPPESRSMLRETMGEKEAVTPSMAKSETPTLNTFKGQILDIKGNPVPNASVMINGKPIGTTTDLQGRFSLPTADSVLNATVAALGYESNHISLKNPAEEKTVVLNEASAALNEVVITAYGTRKKKNAARYSPPQTKAEVEELEPENGWTAFNDYISENIQIPEEVTSKQLRGDVELTFDVNKNGEPVNIKIEKSLCTSCDKEAVRLLQAGPGWKKKKNKTGKIKIHF